MCVPYVVGGFSPFSHGCTVRLAVKAQPTSSARSLASSLPRSKSSTRDFHNGSGDGGGKRLRLEPFDSAGVGAPARARRPYPIHNRVPSVRGHCLARAAHRAPPNLTVPLPVAGSAHGMLWPARQLARQRGAREPPAGVPVPRVLWPAARAVRDQALHGDRRAEARSPAARTTPVPTARPSLTPRAPHHLSLEDSSYLDACACVRRPRPPFGAHDARATPPSPS